MPSPKTLPRLYRSIDDIRAELFSQLESVQQEYAARGWLPARLNLNKGIVRGLIELFAWGQWQLYQLLQRVLNQAVPFSSSETWLDVHADGVDLARRPATKAMGKVRLCRANFQQGNVQIPAGRILRTQPDGKGRVFRYVTTEAAVLPVGADSVQVPVEAEDYGAAANAGTGQICELATPVPGVAEVSNDADWLESEGADTERDDQLAERYRLRWMGNNGVTKHAYKSWALSVPGVSSVSILDKHPRGQGTVDVVVRGSAVLPTKALLEKVRMAIAPNVPINDDWQVKSPIPCPIAIKATLEYVSGDPALIVSQAEARLRTLFADVSEYADVTPLEIGQDFTLDLLTHTVMAVPGVKRVFVQSPVEDIPIGPAGMAMLDSLALDTQAAEEI